MSRNNHKKRDYLNFYQVQLEQAFYRKRGKATTLPHIFFVIQQLLDESELEYIDILDIGCGSGELLSLLEKTFIQHVSSSRIKLSGLDCEPIALADAKRNAKGATFHSIDLTKLEDIRALKQSYDLITGINTFHEIFSQKLLENKTKDSFTYAQNYIKDLLKEVVALLQPDGRIIIYDGLDVAQQTYDKPMQFTFNKPEYEQLFQKFIEEYKTLDLKYKKTGETYSMSGFHFLRFINTFKYLNTPLWPIESKQMYAYFDKEKYKQVLEDIGLTVEVIIEISNDLTTWAQYVTLEEGCHFPAKSIIMVGKKQKE